MTSETRTTIEPEDIRAVELECAKCGFRSICKVGSWFQQLIACPNCNASWLPLREEFTKLSVLANTLHILSHRQKPPDVVIRFEIAAPKPKDAQ